MLSTADYPDLRYATSATTLRPANANAIPNQLQSHISTNLSDCNEQPA